MPAWGRSLGASLVARGARFGSFLLCTECTSSTNGLAQELAKAGAPDGSIVVAERQESGRGRWSRRWESVPGGLYLSVILRPEATLSVGLLPLRSAVAVAEALADAHAVSARLRWPNDVFAEGRKLGGVLCECSFTGAELDFAVVGVGVNVNQGLEDFPEDVGSRATSVRLLTGREADLYQTLVAVLKALERCTEAGGERADLERWRELSEMTRGTRVRVVSRGGDELAAVSDGLADDGGLRVKLDDGTARVLYSEDVSFLRTLGTA